MKNNEVAETLEKLKTLSRWDVRDSVKEYSAEDLESLAIGMYNDHHDRFWDENHNVLNSILRERARRMNENFEWTDENKRRFLDINEKLMRAFEAAYREAQSTYTDMENRLKNNDDFIKDYEIDIKISPYLRGCYYGDKFNEESIGWVLSEPRPFFAPIHESFDKTDFKGEHCLYLDRSRNWNSEHFFGDVFKNDHIGYEIHELLDHRNWSFQDIINIGYISVDVDVSHQHNIEVV